MKIVKFLKKNKFEKNTSIVRNTYSFFYKKKFRTIGKKSYFLSPDFISGYKYIELGEDVGIWHRARFEVLDEWENKSFTPIVKIGNHTNIGQDLHLTCAERIEIENDVLITARVTITDITHEPGNEECPILKRPIKTKPVRICQGAFVGVNSVILPGVTVGKFSIVGANSVVTKDVPDYAVVAGNPAKVIRYTKEQ